MEISVAIAFVVVVAILMMTHRDLSRSVGALRDRLTTSTQTLTAVQNQVANVGLQQEALVQALTRIDDPAELPFLKVHYDVILELLRFRRQGIEEERIVKEFMCFSRSRGWQVPGVDPDSGTVTIYNLSPYYMATNPLKLRELRKDQDRAAERHGPVLRALGWSRDLEPPDATEITLRVSYFRADGKLVEYPSTEDPEPPRRG
ncbi:MAG: hypothetical protein AABZ20_07875 [candidate division NC10 bacterium]